jgi:CheY-specific phosphatase CheX
MDADQQNHFRGSLSQSVLEFFRDYGVDFASVVENPVTFPAADAEMEPPPTSARQCEMGSIVGFKGQNLRGGLAFVAPAELVARMLPVPKVAERADLQLRDWSAEIANQLAGRFKNKLSARAAFDFDVGTAVCFRGMSIRLSFMPSTDGVSLSFTIESAGVRVYLDCSFVCEGAAASDDVMRIIPEGDVVLF